MAGLTASQIAAQAAMQQQQSNQHIRKRSQTVPSPQSPPDVHNGRQKPPPMPSIQSTGVRKVSNGPETAPGPGLASQIPGTALPSPTTAAATAANAAYPRGAQLSPGLTTFSEHAQEKPAPEKESKLKSERSKMKLFSKPKHIGISSYKDTDKKDRPLPSPGKGSSPGPSLLYKTVNASNTSLADTLGSGSASLYSLHSSSTSTLMPKAEDKEKAHRHHFLSRQKHKLRDKMDDHALTLSSASSNSKPTDPNAPQSIYSFVPSSPGPTQGSFSKSVSGLDLRHGGRALREKKREEKAAMPDGKKGDDKNDWLGPASSGAASMFNAGSTVDLTHGNLQGFGLSNLTPEDAWDFLKAKILIIFEGEELRMPVEDLNRLVSIHIQRCVQRKAPTIVTEDLGDLLRTGFYSLDQTLRGIPDDRLVPFLVEMWLFVFGSILPYIQAVFLPLDLEFKGHGSLMTADEAADFWGIVPGLLGSGDGFDDEELDVRRLVLLSYRDSIVLPRHDTLKAIFSRLSLESINVGLDSPLPLPPRSPGAAARPGTSGSLDPGYSSFNSQGSTLLNDANGARSRAASNTSAPELPSFTPPPLRGAGAQPQTQQLPDSSRVTETVGRMLQCMSVLASLRSGDEAQAKMEDLTKTLKLNWLGRGRTGRNRKGFVGARMPRVNQL